MDEQAHLSVGVADNSASNIDYFFWHKTGALPDCLQTTNTPETLMDIGRRNWIRTNDPHHVKVVL